MTHIAYERGDYDHSTKTLYKMIITDQSKPGDRKKAWDVDPQLQIINLLKEILAETTALRHTKEGVVGPDTHPPSPKPLLPDPVTSVVEKGVVSASHTPTSSVE